MKQLLIFMLCTTSFFAQQDARNLMTFNLNEVAMLNIAPNNNTVILNLISPNQPGDQVSFSSSNNTKWINFTSAKALASSPRNLYIKVENGTIPQGIDLKLNVSNYQGSGGGDLGTRTNNLTLNTNNQAIVSGIGGAYTGYGTNNGYRIRYVIEITDYELLNIDNSEVLTISLTLTDF